MYYDSKTVYEAVSAVRQGSTLRAAACLTGVGVETARRWCRSAGISFARGPRGGAILPTRRRAGAPRGRLSLEHRLAIAMGLAAGHAHARIAEAIGFSGSTVSREVSRHARPGGGYDPYEAQMAAERDAARPKARKVDASPRLRAYVAEKLRLR